MNTPSHTNPVDPAHSLVEEEMRHRMIAEAAYFRAEARGFADGYELDDWLEAESEIDSDILPSEFDPLDI